MIREGSKMGVVKKGRGREFQNWRQVDIGSKGFHLTPPTLRHKLTAKTNGNTFPP